MATKKPKGLGRGLEALLGPTAQERGAAGSAATSPGLPASLLLEDMVPGSYQPRTRMDEGALYELAESIKAQGIMQPILVRRLSDERAQLRRDSEAQGSPNGPAAGAYGAERPLYEIIAGERRYRAARLAGLDSVPVLVRDVPDESAAAMALIENIQREDLNPLEEAHGLQRLVKEFGLTHEEAAQAVGRSRSAASNLLRLLNLTEPVQTMLMAGSRWSARHRSRRPTRSPRKSYRCARRSAWSRNWAPSSTSRRPSPRRKNRATCDAWKRNSPTCSPPKSRCA
jgi:ParB family chromosome partitioning protein